MIRGEQTFLSSIILGDELIQEVKELVSEVGDSMPLLEEKIVELDEMIEAHKSQQ